MRKFSKFLLLSSMATIVAMPTMAKPIASNVKIYVDEELLVNESALIDNGNTLVGLRTLFEKMGATVTWDKENSSVIVESGDTIIILPVGDKNAYVYEGSSSAKVIQLSVPAQIVNDKTYVPLRFVSESLNNSVYWDQSTNAIYIRSEKTNISNKTGVIKKTKTGYSLVTDTKNYELEGDISNFSNMDGKTVRVVGIDKGTVFKVNQFTILNDSTHGAVDIEGRLLKDGDNYILRTENGEYNLIGTKFTFSDFVREDVVVRGVVNFSDITVHSIVKASQSNNSSSVENLKLQTFTGKLRGVNMDYVLYASNGSLYYLVSQTDDLSAYLSENVKVQGYLTGDTIVVDSITGSEAAELVNKKPKVDIVMSPNKNIRSETLITWDYNYSDPENDKIIDVEWDNKKLSYSAGTHTVRVRVKDSAGNWSNWSEKTFYVEEASDSSVNAKPVANIKMTPNKNITNETIISWDYTYSDIEGHSKKEVEWTNKHDTYPAGTHTVGVRVQDQYGAWSDWSEITFEVTAVKIDIPIQSIAVSSTHSVALMQDGSIYTWGQNNKGQLGVGDRIDHYEPVAVSTIADVKQIKVGEGFSIALTQSGEVYSWGVNNLGQLGMGDTQLRTAPTKIEGLENVKMLLGSEDTTYAILRDGTVYGWGKNQNQELLVPNEAYLSTPVECPDLNGLKDIDNGLYHTVAVFSDGTVKTWGSNDHYQLGRTIEGEKDYTPTNLDLSNIKSVACGETYTLALSNDGSVYTWGKDQYGAVGLSTSSSSTPKLLDIRGVSQISANKHTSSAVSNGKLYLWGENSENILGVSDKFTAVKKPTEIKNLSSVSYVDARTGLVVAKASNNQFYIWGDNNYGQFGFGNYDMSSKPLKITFVK